jgi:proline iminopeptidase
MQGIVSKINEISIWNITQGFGIPLVLLHGGPGAYDYLEPVAKLLYNHYQVIRYEQRGSWRSEKKGPYNVEIFIDDLEYLRIHLGLESWIVCGHSWGASLALSYASKYNSRVRALIYISGTGINPAWYNEYRVNRLNKMSIDEREEYNSLRSTVDILIGGDKERTRDRIRELSFRTDLFNINNYDKLPRTDGLFVNNDVNQIVASDWNEYMKKKEFKESLSLITTPSLLVHGDEDPRPFKYVNELANYLSNSECRLIPKAGHYPWIDDPATFGEQIQDFLTRKI